MNLKRHEGGWFLGELSLLVLVKEMYLQVLLEGCDGLRRCWQLIPPERGKEGECSACKFNRPVVIIR